MLRKKSEISGFRLIVGIVVLIIFALLFIQAWRLLFKKEVESTGGLIDVVSKGDSDKDGIPDVVDRCKCDASNPEPPEECGESDCSENT